MTADLPLISPAVAIGAKTFGVLLFGTAAVGKARHMAEFEGVFENYRLTPSFATPGLARGLVGCEAMIALSLATGLAGSLGALAAIALLLVFTAAISINLARGRTEIDCGCFVSAQRQELSGWLVVRNLLAAALLATLLAPQEPMLRPFDVINGLGAGIVFFLLTRAMDDLLALRSGNRKLQQRFG